jgi:hypothetical protein
MKKDPGAIRGLFLGWEGLRHGSGGMDMAWLVEIN